MDAEHSHACHVAIAARVFNLAATRCDLSTRTIRSRPFSAPLSPDGACRSTDQGLPSAVPETAMPPAAAPIKPERAHAEQHLTGNETMRRVAGRTCKLTPFHFVKAVSADAWITMFRSLCFETRRRSDRHRPVPVRLPIPERSGLRPRRLCSDDLKAPGFQRHRTIREVLRASCL